MAQRRVLFFDATINKRSDIDFFLQIEFLSVAVKWRRPEAGRAAERAQPPATEQPRQLARLTLLVFLPLHRQRLPSHTQAPSEALQQVLKIRFVIITK